MEHYSFSMIHLSDKDVDSLSGAVKEFLFSESDIIASAGNYGEELERASKVKNILPSLKYFFPQVPKPNEKARPLTNDQKAQNVIYMREARKLWRKAGGFLVYLLGFIIYVYVIVWFYCSNKDVYIYNSIIHCNTTMISQLLIFYA